LLVVFVGVYALSSLRAILLPLLWAFFLMMALLPFSDFTEQMLLRLCSFLAAACRQCVRSRFWDRLRRGGDVAAADNIGPGAEDGRAREVALADASGLLELQEAEESDEPPAQDGRLQRIVRVVAVLVVIVVFLSVSILFVSLVLQSANEMSRDWSWYQKGAKRIADDISKFLNRLSSLVPPDVVDNLTKKLLQGLETAVTAILKPLVAQVADFLVELLMMLLYMVFWLCSPIDIDPTVAGLFKRYIMLKSLVSALYALCIWLLLHLLQVQLAVVFGLLTFLCNFVPEVGPFIAGLLPVPVILFDGRMAQPWGILALALAGELALKFLFGNVIEVKLVESQEDMKMHPVVILFFVAFFGFVWGPTGMLLSVPVVAAVKATARALPPAYRDGLLRLLEGDRHAPARYAARLLEERGGLQMPTPARVTAGASAARGATTLGRSEVP